MFQKGFHKRTRDELSLRADLIDHLGLDPMYYDNPDEATGVYLEDAQLWGHTDKSIFDKSTHTREIPRSLYAQDIRVVPRLPAHVQVCTVVAAVASTSGKEGAVLSTVYISSEPMRNTPYRQVDIYWVDVNVLDFSNYIATYPDKEKQGSSEESSDVDSQKSYAPKSVGSSESSEETSTNSSETETEEEEEPPPRPSRVNLNEDALSMLMALYAAQVPAGTYITNGYMYKRPIVPVALANIPDPLNGTVVRDTNATGYSGDAALALTCLGLPPGIHYIITGGISFDFQDGVFSDNREKREMQMAQYFAIPFQERQDVLFGKPLDRYPIIPVGGLNVKGFLVCGVCSLPFIFPAENLSKKGDIEYEFVQDGTPMKATLPCFTYRDIMTLSRQQWTASGKVEGWKPNFKPFAVGAANLNEAAKLAMMFTHGFPIARRLQERHPPPAAAKRPLQPTQLKPFWRDYLANLDSGGPFGGAPSEKTRSAAFHAPWTPTEMQPDMGRIVRKF